MSISMNHAPSCPAYSNYQPPYEECTCGADPPSTPDSHIVTEADLRAIVFTKTPDAPVVTQHAKAQDLLQTWIAEDTAPPPVGEDDPWQKLTAFDRFGELVYYKSEVDAALTLTRQQQAEQIEKLQEAADSPSADASTAASEAVVYQESAAPIPCGMCGGPCEFDTVVPSVLWNEVISAQGLPEYLCAACIIRQFAKAGVSFTCELWGSEFNGLPVAVHFNSRRALVGKKVSAENSRLRHQLSEAERGCQKLAEQIAEKDRDSARLKNWQTEVPKALGMIGSPYYEEVLTRARQLAEAESREAALRAELAQVKQQRDDALTELTETRRFWKAAKQEIETLRGELAQAKQAAHYDRCQKCDRTVHHSQIAIEVKDGAPIDDPAGFMWCHACHCQRVIETLKQEQGDVVADMQAHSVALKRWALSYEASTEEAAAATKEGAERAYFRVLAESLARGKRIDVLQRKLAAARRRLKIFRKEPK